VNSVNFRNEIQYKQQQIERSEAPMTVVIKTGVFWMVTPCGLVHMYVSTFMGKLSAKLYGVTSQKTAVKN